jgi:DNA replication protein DnaC
MSKRKPPNLRGPATELRRQIQRHLERLGLRGLDIDAHLAWLKQNKASELQALERLLAQATALKRERSVEWRIKGSGLKVRKTMAAFDWDFQPKLDRRTVEDLFTLAFVERHEDLLITGKRGTGKSHILQALAVKACEQEWMVRYARCVDLIDDLYAGLADGSYQRRMKRWCRPPLLVVDDVGLGQLKRRDDEPTAAHMLFTLLDRRHTVTTTALTSNIKLSAWGKYLGDATLAAAVLDRLAATSIHIDIDGPSYRQHLALVRAGERPGGKPMPSVSEEEA